MANRPKYPLTPEAKEAAKELVRAWDKGEIEQMTTVIPIVGDHGMSLIWYGDVNISSEALLHELARFDLIQVTPAVKGGFHILLLQELRNFVVDENGAEQNISNFGSQSPKYQLTEKAQNAARTLVQAWDEGKLAQFSWYVEAVDSSGSRKSPLIIDAIKGGEKLSLGIWRDTFIELDHNKLLKFEQLEEFKFSILLLQDLKNAVGNDFEITNSSILWKDELDEFSELLQSEKKEGRIYKVFISYRRSDSSWATRFISHLLTEKLGEIVFLDIQSIRPFSNFAMEIEKGIKSSDIVIVMVGSTWLTVTDENDNLRLHNPDDFVRQEVALAIKENKTILPLRIDDSPLHAKYLPDDMKAIASINSPSVTIGNVYDVVKLLIDEIKPIIEQNKKGRS